jgi:thiol:disulfide interchange protein DsbD
MTGFSKFFSLFVAVCISCCFSQSDPVTWKAEYLKKSSTEGTIKITGMLKQGWHTYSTKTSGEGPVPTSFTFQPAPFYELKNDIREEGVHEEFVPAFDTKLLVFSGKAVFLQDIRLKKKGKNIIRIRIEYMSCNDQMCLPPKTIDLQVKTES